MSSPFAIVFPRWKLKSLNCAQIPLSPSIAISHISAISSSSSVSFLHAATLSLIHISTSEMNDPDSRPQISSDPLSLEGYTTLYLGYPIWWGDAPRIMSTFVETHDFNGITIIPFCTSGGSGIGQSSDHLAKQAGSGTWLPGQRFSGSTSDDEITSWLAEPQ